MADDIKDKPENQSDDKPGDIKPADTDQVTTSPADEANKQTVGADVPDKAQPLPPEAGSVAPAEEVEAKTKPEIPAGEKLKTEAKVEQALPDFFTLPPGR